MSRDIIGREEIVALLSDLIRIPSVRPPWGAGEAEIARYLSERLKVLHLAPTVTEVEPGRPNVVVTVPGKAGGQHLLFEAHTDTVPPSTGQVGAFTPRVEGDRLYGRGSCDTKASVAAAFVALASVLPLRERGATVTLAFTMGEELGHDGAKFLAASGLRADGAVIGEPTGLDVVAAHKGAVRWRMVTVGKSAHSSTPEKGCNAIVKMAAVIRALEERLIPELGRRNHPLVGSPTLCVGRIEGGLQPNIVPDRCVIELDQRILPGESWEDVRRELEAVLAPVRAADPELELVIEDPYQSFGSMEVAPDAPIVRLAQDAVRRVEGEHSIRGVAYGTDAAELAAVGIPCVVLGPGDIAQAHSSTEYVEIRQVVKAAAIYREMMLGA
jgi:acetylornithine deacetylase